MTLYQRIVVGAVALLILGSIAMSIGGIVQDVPVMADIESLPVIVIDPGHGGIDGGAVGVDGIVEKDINLSISLTLRDMFVANGFRVVMTRDADLSIHDEGVEGTRKQKTSDLHNRLAIVNEYPDAIFISIHQNKFGDSSSWGAQIFHSPNHSESERLAALVQETFRELQPENNREYKEAGKNLYLMYEAQCPAVLIECGFLSNPEEARNLTDEEYQSKVAFTVLVSVFRYLELDAPMIAPSTEEV